MSRIRSLELSNIAVEVLNDDCNVLHRAVFLRWSDLFSFERQKMRDSSKSTIRINFYEFKDLFWSHHIPKTLWSQHKVFIILLNLFVADSWLGSCSDPVGSVISERPRNMQARVIPTALVHSWASLRVELSRLKVVEVLIVVNSILSCLFTWLIFVPSHLSFEFVNPMLLSLLTRNVERLRQNEVVISQDLFGASIVKLPRHAKKWVSNPTVINILVKDDYNGTRGAAHTDVQLMLFRISTSKGSPEFLLPYSFYLMPLILVFESKFLLQLSLLLFKFELRLLLISEFAKWSFSLFNFFDITIGLVVFDTLEGAQRMIFSLRLLLAVYLALGGAIVLSKKVFESLIGTERVFI